MAKCDRWTLLRIVETLLVTACLIFKRVTDDEARSLGLYLQKLSREWGLLNNITWSRIGSSVADATFGGYIIITFALLMGKIFGELPTRRRIVELILLGVGAIMFITLGSLAFASIDSVPHGLVDNAAIMGTLSLLVGTLFLLDMGGPKGKPLESKKKLVVESSPPRRGSKTTEHVSVEMEREREELRTPPPPNRKSSPNIDKRKVRKNSKNNGIKNNGEARQVESVALKEVPDTRSYIHLDPTFKGYKQMQEDDLDFPRRFGIYGKDATDYDTDETASIPPKIELHTPVWSNIRKERVKQYIVPSVMHAQRIPPDPDEGNRPPSGPLEPGYVQYTAQHWGETKKNGSKTPRHSPTQV